MYHNKLLLGLILLIALPSTIYVTILQANYIFGQSGKEQKDSNNNFASYTDAYPTIKERLIGAYNPQALHLDWMEGSEQRQAISSFVDQGFDRYFFPMTDFNSQDQITSTEKLLDAVDDNNINTTNRTLKTIIILLPPSEGGPTTNYDWEGWVSYFNELKSRHQSSFDGFAIDDLNWISDRNDTKFKRNIDFMQYSKFAEALAKKDTGVNFYPVVYFEGWGTDVVVKEYAKYAKSIIVGSTKYYNISKLENNLSEYKKMFNNKPIEYVVYPLAISWYRNHGYGPPSDRLVMATLSIATRMADGIIVLNKIDNHVIQDYLRHSKDTSYLQALHTMEELQIANERQMHMS